MTRIAFAFALFAVLAAPLAVASDEKTTTVQQSAVRVHVDPATGRRSAHPAENVRRGAAPGTASPELSQSSEGLVERPAPDGGVIVDLQGRYQSATMIRVGKDGEREVYCTDATHADGAPHRHGTASEPDVR